MKIGIFSKFECAGGSEFRCVELANGILKHSGHTPVILVRGSKLPDKVRERLHEDIKIVLDAPLSPPEFYNLDQLVTINTDSKEFTTVEYWDFFLDLDKLPSMAFLFNFIVSPARHLVGLSAHTDVRIITTNKRFYDEIGKKDKHIPIRSLPRTILESPIDPKSVLSQRVPGDKIRIGMHSKGVGNKWNEEYADLINRLNAAYPDKLQFDFMGGSSAFCASVIDIDNVMCREAFSIPVSIFLLGLDLFLFYPSYSRQEPWCRVVGEAMMDGLPLVVTDTDGGNRMQVVNECNGYLGADFDAMYTHLSRLIENQALRTQMGRNSRIFAQNFRTESIIRRLLDFIS